MPRFNYTAIDLNKKTVRGAVSAESPYAARKHLRNRGLRPTAVKEAVFQDERRRLLSLGMNKKKEVAEFTIELSTMLNAGIKLTEALSVMVQQISNPRFKNAISEIRDRVVSGESFADSLEEYSTYFDIIYVSMVRVGEVTGTLPGSLNTLGNFMKKHQRIESKVITMMIYPVILVAFCLFAAIFLTVKVIPPLAAELTKTGQELPFLTKLMVDISGVLTSWRVVIVISSIIGIIWLLHKFFSTERGGYLKDKTLLSLPFFGPLLKQRIVARFASTLSTLLRSGLSMAESLRIVAQVTGNKIMNRAVIQARDRILSGADITTPLRDSGVISPTIAHMVTVGEKTGELEQMLLNIAENLESSTDVVIERLMAALEPVIIMIVALVVGGIAYAAMMPMFQYSSGQF